MEFRTDIIVANAGAIAEGVCMTLLLTCFSFLVALALGTVVGVLRRRAGLLSALLGGYVSFFRGTPLLIQLFLIYYGLPSIGLNMPRYVAAVLSLGLNSAAILLNKPVGYVSGQAEDGYRREQVVVVVSNVDPGGNPVFRIENSKLLPYPL